MKKEKALSENVYKGRFYRVVDVAEAVKKLKEELCLGCKGKGCSNCERIDKIMGNFNHSPQDTKLNSGDSSFKSQPEDNNIKGCGKTFKQKSNLSEYTARCGQLICPEVELCPKCQEKYTKKYSKRNGIHQVGLKEDKRR